MRAGFFDTLQTWIADMGWGQYPLPRRRSSFQEPKSLAERWIQGMMLLLWFLAALLMIGLAVIALYACYQLAWIFFPMMFGH